MESLRVNKKNVYQIEVNDNGEYIEFDLQDIGLRSKLYHALEEVEKIQNDFIEKSKEFKTDKDSADAEVEVFQKLRNAMDGFLGEGACQKIFGDRNYPEMYDDLMRELTRKRKELGYKSHFDMLEIQTKAVNKKIVDKYNKNKKNVI